MTLLVAICRRLLVVLVALALAACHLALPAGSGSVTATGSAGRAAPDSAIGSNDRPGTFGGKGGAVVRAGEVPSLSGQISFGSWRTTQATMADVAVGATVSLIDTATNTTVSSTVTDAAAQFVMTFPGSFQPSGSTAYVLEAVKGLGTNAPSRNLARVRTVVRWAGTGWTSIGNAAPGPIYLDTLTTAVAIGAALRGVSAASTIDKVTIGSPDTLNAAPALAGLSDPQILTVRQLVQDALAADLDPVAAIAWNGTAFVRNSTGIAITGVSESSSTADAILVLTGTGFDPAAASNTVNFAGGASRNAYSATSTRLKVTVPEGAVSGSISLTVGGLTVLGPNLAVTPTFTSFSNSSGSAGSSRTVNGTGFSTTPSENVVTFSGGANATVTAATATALTVTVPGGAISGAVTITVLGASVTTAAFTVPVTVSAISPASAMPGDAITMTGTGFSTTPGNNTVTFQGAAAGTVTAATATSLTVTVPGTTTGVIQVSVAGQSADSPTFTFLRPSLLALSDSIAGSGQILTLEGQFGPDPVVNFPGGLSLPASGSPNHATIPVPRGAGTGNLTVSSLGYTTQALPFRAPSFTVGLGSVFQGWYDQATGGRQMPALTTVRQNFGSAVIGRYVYVFGGMPGPMASVERAEMDAAGHLGPFKAVATVNLQTARHSFGVAVIGGYCYAFGGMPGAGYSGTVERATIDASGNLSTFETVADVTLAVPRAYFSTAVLGRYLYLTGGEGGAGVAQTSVERAGIDSNGNLSNFQTVPGVDLETARLAHGNAVIGKYLYIFGGGGDLASVERAPVNASGALGDFEPVPAATLRTGRHGFGSAVFGGALYVFGGMNSGGYLGSVERAAIGPAYELRNFETVPSVALNTARRYFGTAVAGSQLHLFGGQGLAGQQLGSVEEVSLNASGNLSRLVPQSGGLFNSRGAFCTAVVGNYLYLIGGLKNGAQITSVERAPINPDGSLGAFGNATGVALQTARAGCGTAIVGDYLYVIGGKGSTGMLQSIEQATINGDGSLTGFISYGGSQLGLARGGFGVAVTRGTSAYVYVFGGATGVGGGGGAKLSNVERLPITSAAGDLGASEPVSPGVQLSTARSLFCSAVIGPYVYAVAGQTGGPIGSVERATINLGSGVLSNFGAVSGVNLVTARSGRYNCAVAGNHLYVYGGYNSGFLGSVERAPISAAGDLGRFQTVRALSLNTPRNAFASAIIGDYLYVLGGSNGADLGSVERAALQ